VRADRIDRKQAAAAAAAASAAAAAAAAAGGGGTGSAGSASSATAGTAALFGVEVVVLDAVLASNYVLFVRNYQLDAATETSGATVSAYAAPTGGSSAVVGGSGSGSGSSGSGGPVRLEIFRLPPGCDRPAPANASASDAARACPYYDAPPTATSASASTATVADSRANRRAAHVARVACLGGAAGSPPVWHANQRCGAACVGCALCCAALCVLGACAGNVVRVCCACCAAVCGCVGTQCRAFAPATCPPAPTLTARPAPCAHSFLPWRSHLHHRYMSQRAWRNELSADRCPAADDSCAGRPDGWHCSSSTARAAFHCPGGMGTLRFCGSRASCQSQSVSQSAAGQQSQSAFPRTEMCVRSPSAKK
jgi:hypothetical protein